MQQTKERTRGGKETFSMTITFDRKTSDILEELKTVFGASSKAEVIRKAIALLDIAKEARETGSSINVRDTQGVDHKILL